MSYLFRSVAVFFTLLISGSVFGQLTVDFAWTAGAWDEEAGYAVVDDATGLVVAFEGTGNPVPVSQTVSLPAGSYTVLGYDSFGDGWNGATLDISAAPSGGLAILGGGSMALTGGGTPNTGMSVGAAPTPTAPGIAIGSFSIVMPNCTITCPADITVSNDPGVCGANVTVPQPTTDMCAGAPASFVTFSGVQAFNYNFTGIIETDGFATGTYVAPVLDGTITINYFGDFSGSNGFETPDVFGEDGTLLGTLDGPNQGDCSSTGETVVFPITMAQIMAWGADGSITITVGEDADVDDFCARQEFEIEITWPTEVVSATNDFNGTGDASGDYPVGTTVVTWTAFDITGAPSTCQQSITVVDDENPEITCPASVSYDLAPGACNIPHVYDLPAVSDNCPFYAPAPIYTPLDWVNGALSSYDAVSFDLVNQGTEPMLIETIELPTGQGINDWELFAHNTGSGLGASINASEWTSVATATGVPGGTNVVFTLANPITLAPGASQGFNVVLNTGGNNGLFYVFPPVPTIAPDPNGLLMVAGGATSAPFGGILLNPRGALINVGYSFVVEPLVQIAGLPSGSEFPVGTTTNIFEVTDNAGNVSTCSFDVVVNGYPNAITSLSCNDMINFSLDAGCTATVGADQVLEGGPYACYDLYVVEINRNGNWTPATLTGSDIGNVYEIRVTDPATGNSCWGNILVEDKNAPTLDCGDPVTFPCNFPTTEPGSSTVVPLVQGDDDGGFAIPTSGTVNVEFTVTNGIAPITDVNIALVTDHTWVGDLTATLTSPSGTVVNLFGQPGGGGCLGDGLDVLFDDDAANTQADFLSTCDNNPAIAGDFQPASPLAAFNGEDPNGVWTLTINDLVGGDGGPNSAATLYLAPGATLTVPFPNGLTGADVTPLGNRKYRVNTGAGAPVLEACSNVTLSYTDVTTPQSCATGLTEIITRKWVAVDASGNQSSCEQTIELERYGMEDVTFPEDATLTCTDNIQLNSEGNPDPSVTGSPTILGSVDGCSVSWTYEDDRIEICDGTYKVRREWRVIDWCSNEDQDYVQIIKVLDETAPVINIPAPDTIVTTTVNVVPVYDGTFPVTYDTLGVTTTTRIIPYRITASVDPFSCESTVDLPDFIVSDACSRIASATATIVVTDENGFETSHEISGTLQDFPGNNYGDRDTLMTFGSAPNLPLGFHEVTYTIEDDCGNVASVSFDIRILDLIPPSISCDEHTQVSIGVDDPNDCYFPDADACTFAGVSWVDAEVFNDGSYDNCGDIYWTVRRMTNPDTFGYFGGFVPGPGFSEFIRGLNSINSENRYFPGQGFDECLRWATPSGVNPEFPAVHDELRESPAGTPFVYPSEFALATNYWALGNYTPANQFGGTYTAAFPQFGLRYSPLSLPYQTYTGALANKIDIELVSAFSNDNPIDGHLLGSEKIKFYCGEVGTTQTVIVRGYQIDADGRMQMDATGNPIYNECMVDVSIVDKTRPVCQAPANVTVDCESFDPSLWAYGTPSVYDNCCLDTDLEYNGQKGITHTASYSQFDSTCNVGRITRTFRVFDCTGLSSSCTQTVTVEYNQDYYIQFPDDVTITECNGSGTYGEPIIYDEDCELIGISYNDEVLTAVNGACYKIERTWKITNWCTYDANSGCEYVINPSSSTTGPRLSPFAPNTGHPHQATNIDYFNQYMDNRDANCWVYKQIITVFDTEDPVVSTTQPTCDLTPNASNYYNDNAWFDAVTGLHDLCEGPADLSITATDSCSGDDLHVRYILFLDTDGDGVMETVINSDNAPAAGFVNVGNNNANFAGGTPTRFDLGGAGRDIYRFGLKSSKANGTVTASVAWKENRFYTDPAHGVTPELPYGTHKIKWLVTDGCGNEATSEFTFEINDCKKPTVVCKNGLSLNIMNTNPAMVQLWANDVLEYVEDNCTPANQIKYAICAQNAVNAWERCSGSFPLNQSGLPNQGVTWDCSALGMQEVQIWAQDLAGNTDYCVALISVQDNAGACNAVPRVQVAGALESNQAAGMIGLENANVDLNGSHPAMGAISEEDISDLYGEYMFPAVPTSGNYSITPTKDDDHLNGVNTFDLLLIQKHLLGIQVLDNPYRMIAADVNKSNSISATDIVELRKLILGVHNNGLPMNTSWRFVDRDYALGANPFANNGANIKEVLNLNDLQSNMTSGMFEAVKIGDLDGNAVLNATHNVDDRTSGTMLFDVADRAVKAGEEFTVDFTAAEKAAAYQFTLNLNGLEVVDIVPGADMDASNFAVFASKNAITTSADGVEGNFSIVFRATTQGQLSEMISLSSSITRAIAFDNDASRQDVALRFDGETISGVGFELYQNTPNPFIDRTVIGFNLPEAAEATLTVYDETGRLLYTSTADYGKGYNAVSLTKAELSATGVLFYTVTTGDETATKQMIQTK